MSLASGANAESPPPIPLRGFVKDSPGSSVRITINKNFISGYIQTNSGTLNLQPAWYYDASANKDLVVSLSLIHI